MAFSDYSTTPANNTTIKGINIAEGCAAGNLNNALRQIAADGKTLNNTVSGLAAGLPATGGTVSGNIVRSGGGVHVYWNDAGQSSGKIFIQASGGSAPAMSNGDILFEF